MPEETTSNRGRSKGRGGKNSGRNRGQKGGRGGGGKNRRHWEITKKRDTRSLRREGANQEIIN